jgi:hypothetical protein
MKRPAIPTLSDAGQQALEAYSTALGEHTDISNATVRNYSSDLRQFIAWCESTWAAGQKHAPAFTPTALTTPLITRYRTYLQHTQHLKPASVNRALVRAYAASNAYTAPGLPPEWRRDRQLRPRRDALLPAPRSTVRLPRASVASGTRRRKSVEPALIVRASVASIRMAQSLCSGLKDGQWVENVDRGTVKLIRFCMMVERQA